MRTAVIAYESLGVLADDAPEAAFGGASPGQNAPKIRKDFPETWIWNTIHINNRLVNIRIYVVLCFKKYHQCINNILKFYRH